MRTIRAAEVTKVICRSHRLGQSYRFENAVSSQVAGLTGNGLGQQIAVGTDRLRAKLPGHFKFFFDFVDDED